MFNSIFSFVTFRGIKYFSVVFNVASVSVFSPGKMQLRDLQNSKLTRRPNERWKYL